MLFRSVRHTNVGEGFENKFMGHARESGLKIKKHDSACFILQGNFHRFPVDIENISEHRPIGKKTLLRGRHPFIKNMLPSDSGRTGNQAVITVNYRERPGAFRVKIGGVIREGSGRFLG